MIETKSIYLEGLKKNIQQKKGSFNRETRNFNFSIKDATDWAVDNVYKYIPHSQLMADGGETNAWLTEHTVEKIIQTLKSDFNVTENDILLDAGCSYNIFGIHAA